MNTSQTGHHRQLIGRPQEARWKSKRGVTASPPQYIQRGEKWGERQQQQEADTWSLYTVIHTVATIYTTGTTADSITTTTTGPSGIPYSVHPSRSSTGAGKFGDMQSLYRHFISLLFVLSSLHVYQLTEGCSCALSHPQDAFCNAEIGKWRLTLCWDKNCRIFFSLSAMCVRNLLKEADCFSHINETGRTPSSNRNESRLNGTFWTGYFSSQSVSLTATGYNLWYPALLIACLLNLEFSLIVQIKMRCGSWSSWNMSSPWCMFCREYWERLVIMWSV